MYCCSLEHTTVRDKRQGRIIHVVLMYLSLYSVCAFRCSRSLPQLYQAAVSLHGQQADLKELLSLRKAVEHVQTQLSQIPMVKAF